MKGKGSGAAYNRVTLINGISRYIRFSRSLITGRGGGGVATKQGGGGGT